MEAVCSEWHLDPMIIEETWTFSQFFMFTKRMTERLQKQTDKSNGVERDHGKFAMATGLGGGQYPNMKSERLKREAANEH